MTDLLDKAIALGLEVEKRLKQTLEGIASKAQEKSPEEPGLSSKQRMENKLVEEGVLAIRELISAVKTGKEKVDKELQGVVERLLEKCKVASRDDIEIIEKMAQTAREKVDKLEKRIEELEKTVTVTRGREK